MDVAVCHDLHTKTLLLPLLRLHCTCVPQLIAARRLVPLPAPTTIHPPPLTRSSFPPQAAYECMDELLDRCYDRVDAAAFIQHLESGLRVRCRACTHCCRVPECAPSAVTQAPAAQPAACQNCSCSHAPCSSTIKHPALPVPTLPTCPVSSAGPLRREDAVPPHPVQAGRHGTRPGGRHRGGM